MAQRDGESADYDNQNSVGVGPNSHYPDKSDVGVSQYTKYWKKYDDECEYLKKFNIGWFLHAWYGEVTFDIVFDNGSYVIPHWRPRKC